MVPGPLISFFGHSVGSQEYIDAIRWCDVTSRDISARAPVSYSLLLADSRDHKKDIIGPA